MEFANDKATIRKACDISGQSLYLYAKGSKGVIQTRFAAPDISFNFFSLSWNASFYSLFILCLSRLLLFIDFLLGIYVLVIRTQSSRAPDTSRP